MHYQMREILDNGEKTYTIVLSSRGSGKAHQPLPSTLRALALQQSKPLIEVIVPKVHPLYKCAYIGTIEFHCHNDFTPISFPVHQLLGPVKTFFDEMMEWTAEQIRKEKRSK